MAISTTVFAPTVRTVQPAFIYSTGEAKIYFSLSSYNTKADIQALRYTLIDPNKKSAYGNNSMITDANNNNKIMVSALNIKGTTPEYYFIINFNSDPIRELQLNQYYQIQIELQDLNGNWSAPSQATLIRPIAAGNFIFDLPTSGTEVDASQLKTISGSYQYDNDASSTEYIASYNIYIYKDTLSDSNLVYETGWVHNVNSLSISAPIDYIFVEGATYIIKLNAKTVNGYELNPSPTHSVTIKNYNNLSNWGDFQFDMREFKNDENRGAIQMKVSFDSFYGYVTVQRTDELSGFNLWEDIFEIKLEENSNSNQGMFIYDYHTSGDTRHYKYRFIKTVGAAKAIAKNDAWIIESNYEGIFLADSKRQLGIRYNTNISNFKWVVQESITNTLGGKYALIRRNGDTYYKQFTMSGTLYFDPLALSDVGTDSRGESLNDFFQNESSSLFISVNEALGEAWDADRWNNKSFQSKLATYEQRFKDAAMKFLTDGKPKLFRSPTEGSMIVMLTNVTFTPNKQLGRRVVDFSATVTECADASLVNLVKYEILPATETIYYVLEANRSETYDSIQLTPYLSDAQIIEEESGEKKNYYLRIVERRVSIE